MQEETTYPGVVIEQVSVTPRPDNQVNPPVDDDIISPDKVKVARLMIG